MAKAGLVLQLTIVYTLKFKINYEETVNNTNKMIKDAQTLTIARPAFV